MRMIIRIVWKFPTHTPCRIRPRLSHDIHHREAPALAPAFGGRFTVDLVPQASSPQSADRTAQCNGSRHGKAASSSPENDGYPYELKRVCRPSVRQSGRPPWRQFSYFTVTTLVPRAPATLRATQGRCWARRAAFGRSVGGLRVVRVASSERSSGFRTNQVLGLIVLL